MSERQREFKFEPAIRRNTPIILVAAGASGSGKTWSLLEFAMGLAGKGKVALIDTEGNRSLLYSDYFKFDHCELRAPYNPRRFLDALKAAEQRGYAVVIVDSMSDSYVGEGGMVDMANAEMERVKNSAASWAKPKAENKLVVRWFRQARCHVLLALRAEEKVRLEKVQRGGREQTVVVPIGWQMISEKNLAYEATVSFMLHPEKPGVPHPVKLPEQFKAFFPLDRPVNRATGERLAAWCAGGAPPQPAAPQKEPPAAVIIDPREAADDGLDSAFDRDDPFGFGDLDDPGPVVAPDGLPMRLNAFPCVTGQSDEVPVATGFAEPAEKEPAATSTASSPGPSDTGKKPNLSAAGMGWPDFAASITANIRAYDAQDLRTLRKSLDGHEFKSAAPMLYAKVLGELLDRERALGGKRR